MKTLNIKPDGNLIKGGTICYTIEPSGQVHLSVTLKTHYLFNDHEIDHSGDYQVDPKLVQSKNVRKNESVEIGSLKLTIQNITGRTAVATASLDIGSGRTAQGHAVIDLMNHIIELDHLEAEGVIFGQHFKIEAN